MADYNNSSAEKEPRVLLVGDIGVGKSSIFNRFKTGQFIEDCSWERPTRPESEYTKCITIEGRPDVTVRTS